MKRLIPAALLILVVGAAAGIWATTNDAPASTSGPPEPLTLAVPMLESSAPIYIAADQHLFEKHGLAVTTRDYASGLSSVEGMLRGEADVAAPAEFMIVSNALNNRSIRGLASYDKAQYIYLIGRRDHGVRNVSDLAGRRVGTNRGTIGEFYLNRFLTLHGMSIADATIVDAKVPQAVEMIAHGDVDAVAVIQPYAGMIREQLGENAVVWEVQLGQPLFAVLVSSDDWIGTHHTTAVRLLRAIDDANRFILARPTEAQAVVRGRLNLSEAYTRTVWEQNQFSLSLDQSLVMAMEEEARWMMATNATNATRIPDFREYLYRDALAEVRPEAVRIIG